MSKAIFKRKANLEAEEKQQENEKRKKTSTTVGTMGDIDLSQIGDIGRTKKEPISKAGSIERIYMKNFKCHSVLEFNLHKSINFILGRNGSGKSAVMDAVILCLGGNARSTGRQASAKTFIKTNHDKAELSITLRNDGEDAYKANEYGNRITIERKITSDGSSSYRLLSSEHKTVSNKKTEVDNIIEQFNIQVNNPVCFLNQETSKHFLNSSNNNDKYKLFMKASQLESMKQIQEEIENERHNGKVLIEEKESHLPKLEEELYEWEDKYKKCQSVDKLRKKLNGLMQEYAWSSAIEYEKKIEELQKGKRIILKSKEKHDQKVQESEENYKKICGDYDRFKNDINEIKVKTQELNEKHSKHEKIYKEKYQKFKQVQNDTKKYQSVIKHKKQERQQLVEKYEEEKQKNQQDFQEERTRIEAKITNLKEEINKLASQEKVKTNENQQYTAEIERNTKQWQDRQYELNSLDKRIEGLKTEILNMKNSNKNKIFQFGDYMNDLCNEMRALADRGKFKQTPRGPIGMYVEPVKYEWALAIEQCIGGLVNSFICANYDDEKLMHQLIAKYVKNPIHRPRVIVNKFDAPLYDVSAYRPPLTQFPTVYEMLRISDPIVANALIDQRKIESVLLLPNRDIGREIMEKNVPTNCNEAFLPNGDQLYGRPSYRAYACGTKTPRIFIKDVQSNIESKELEIRRSIEQREILKKEMKEFNDKVQSNKTLKQANENVIDSLRRKISNTKYQLKETEGVQLPEPVDLAVYEEEINKMTAEIEEVENKIKNEVENYDEIKSEYEAADEERRIIENERQKHNEFVEKIRNNHSQHDEDKANARDAFNHYKNLLDGVLKQLADKDNEIQKNEGDLAKYTAVASELCPRIDTKRQPKTIETEIQQIEIQIKITEKNHGSEEEISRRYMEMKTRYNNIVSDIAKQKMFLKRLKQILIERDKYTKTSIESKSVRCAIDFSNLVASRDYNGTLKFDHENQKLEINVHPNKSKENNDNRDLKSLSGGERSFSTVSFLLALWTIVESPILFLDEFDVFMDQVNRRFAMELILNAAKERLSGQYVFLTPQEMGFIQLDNTLKVFKMPDPTRAIDMTDEDNRNN